MRKLLSGTIAAFALAATPVHGETIKVADSTVQFDFEKKVDAYGITCNLITMIVDPVRPEVVNLRIIEALSTVIQEKFFSRIVWTLVTCVMSMGCQPGSPGHR